MATDHVLHDKLEQTSNPVAPLALIVLPSAEGLGAKINSWIHYFRAGDHNEHRDDPTYEGYYEEDYPAFPQVKARLSFRLPPGARMSLSSWISQTTPSPIR